MSELVAYSTFIVTMGIAITRPQVGPRWHVGPGAAAVAGVAIFLAFGIVQSRDLFLAASTLWRPFVTIVAIMTMTAAARRLGVLDRVAEIVFRHPGLTIRQLFLCVFVLSACTASLLNNDAAVLLLTPLVIALVQKRYPGHRQLLRPFAFVVFMAAGVAPFVVSNPMNMIVASSAGLDFNAYAVRMVPISLAGWIVGFLILRQIFGEALDSQPPLPPVPAGAQARLSRLKPGPAVLEKPGPAVLAPVRTSSAQGWMLVLLVAVLGSYPVMASVDPAAIWMVSSAGAILAIGMASWQREVNVLELLARGIAWEILVFLLAVFVIAIGLRNVGLVSYLTAIYEDAGIGLVGATAAFGSALLNNHPMAIMNVLALDAIPRAGHREVLAALIGGDLGPRLLPIGSLAGLLWLESCRRLGVEISLRQFVRVGFAVTVPTLAVSLAILALAQ